MTRDIQWSHSVTVSVAVPYGRRVLRIPFSEVERFKLDQIGVAAQLLDMPREDYVRWVEKSSSQCTATIAWRRRNTENDAIGSSAGWGKLNGWRSIAKASCAMFMAEDLRLSPNSSFHHDGCAGGIVGRESHGGADKAGCSAPVSKMSFLALPPSTRRFCTGESPRPSRHNQATPGITINEAAGSLSGANSANSSVKL